MQQTAHRRKPHPAGSFAHPVRNVAVLGIEKGMAVADFGSGSGAYVLAIADVLANTGHVYAVDVQRDLLRRIHTEAHIRGFKNVGIIWGDLERAHGSKIAERSLDMVLISNLLFQVNDKRGVLAEAWRVLKPTGHLAVIDWADSFRGMGPVEKDVVSQEQFLELAAKAGFDTIREFDAGAHHYGFLMRLVPKKHS